MPLPRPLVGSAEPHFSFAGLKSAVQRAVASGEHRPEDIAASFQQAVVDCLVDRTARALDASDAPTLVVAGGVAANGAIRDRARRPRRASTAAASACRPAWLCTDNAAMIAWAGAERLRRRADRRARRAGAGALAARSSGGKGARRGGEGMRIGVVGGGAWGTALAQVAAHGGPVLLWARAASPGPSRSASTAASAARARASWGRMPKRTVSSMA